MSIVLDEAEPAGRLVESIQSHHEALDLATFGEELVDLFFRSVERPEKA